MRDDPGQVEGRDSPPLVVVPPVVMTPPIEPQREPLVWRTASLDERGALAEDILCRQCGYNLRGLTVEQSCPECGTPVEKSVRTDLLQFANPEWLGRVKRGLKYIIAGIFTTIGVQVLGTIAIMMVAAYAMSQQGPGGGPNPFGGSEMAIVTGLMSVLAAACSLITIAGVWLFTSPDPGTPEARAFNVRTVTRWAYLANFFALPANMMLQANNPGFGGPGIAAAGFTDAYAISITVSLIAGVCTGVAQITGLVLLRRLFLRVPRPASATQARVVVWGYGLSAGLGMVVGLISAILMMQLIGMNFFGGGAGGAPGGAPGGAGLQVLPGAMALMIVSGIGGCVSGLSALVFGVWAIVLLFIAYFAVRDAHTKAAASWAA